MTPLAPSAPAVHPALTVGLAAVAALAAGAFLVGIWIDDGALRLMAKPVPVLALLGWVLAHRRTPYALLVSAGLALSVLGDILLEVPLDLFVGGLLAFLVAHLAYIAAALLDTRAFAPLRAIPFVVWCGGVYVWLLPGMGDLAIPVAVYVTVIGLMLWRMAARAGPGRPDAWIALAGAVAFALSDSLIAVSRFGGPFPGAREAIILLYWAGQVGIAASVLGPAVLRRR
jgi:alkenylglycerophosphocholine hydrolase